MQDIYVVGVGMTPFGKFRDKTIKAIFSNAVQGHMEGQHMIRG